MPGLSVLPYLENHNKMTNGNPIWSQIALIRIGPILQKIYIWDPKILINIWASQQCDFQWFRGCCKKNRTSILKPCIDGFYGYINVFYWLEKLITWFSIIIKDYSAHFRWQNWSFPVDFRTYWHTLVCKSLHKADF